MAPKRCYTRHNMSIAENELEPSDPANIYANKRRKPIPPAPKAMPTSHILSGGGRPHGAKKPPQTSSKKAPKNHNKNQKFNGPTSLPGDAMDLDEDSSVSSSFTHVNVKRTPAMSSNSLYGGGGISLTSYAAQLKNQQGDEKKKTPVIYDVSDDSSTEGGILLPSNMLADEYEMYSDDMDLVEYNAELAPVKSKMRGGSGPSAAELSERIFRGRGYEPLPAPPPQKTFCGQPMATGSDLVMMWVENQTNSPLLRLPLNARRRIYQYTLGGHSIEFKFQTYVDGKPYFRYVSDVYHEVCDPFSDTISREPFTMGMTLLNSVCRQLYQETYTLPYSLNNFFFHDKALFNFVVMEDMMRLLPQQLRAFTSIVVLYYQPGPAIIDMLPNLEYVRVMYPQISGEVNRYRVVVKGKKRELVKDTSLFNVNLRGGFGSGQSNYSGGMKEGGNNSNGPKNKMSKLFMNKSPYSAYRG